MKIIVGRQCGSLEIKLNSLSVNADKCPLKISILGVTDHALYPDPDEGEQRAEGDHDVGVVRPRPGDHAAQLRVAVGA